mmetsp:Transcript_51938/g.59280  ORF Transcript_51938/g.59280 Transcript_51938/m.59280 type:complete len:153 (-) Transcript_51938:261-719(-)
MEQKNLGLSVNSQRSCDLGKFCSYQQDYQESIDQGFELQKLGKFKDASDSYQRAVDLGASDASVYVNLGIIHKKIGNVDEALKNLNMALEIQPSNIAAIKSKMALLFEFQRWDEALDWIDYALRWDPGSADEHNLLKLSLLKNLYNGVHGKE